MRKLKLQVQMTIDGFIAGKNGESDWMQNNWDDEFKKYEYDLADASDTLLMGRKRTAEFVTHWETVADNQPDSDWNTFAQKMVAIPKIVFGKTISTIEGKNTRVENGDVVSVVRDLKNKNGKDILVYGGESFVYSLVKENLIDEIYFFINTAIIGKGKTIFI